MARPQSVAEHSYRVAILALEIRERLQENVREGIREAVLLRWALVHDGPESKLGDIPAPAKALIGKTLLSGIERGACDWYQQEHLTPSAQEYALVWVADIVEALTWVSRYGDGLRDKFDNEDIKAKLLRLTHERIQQAQDQMHITGLKEAMVLLLGEITI